jgi:chromosome segregation ATPase
VDEEYDQLVRLVVSAVVVSAALAFAAAGCGGGGASAEEKWAGSVCTDITSWKQHIQKEVDDARTALQSPGAGTMDAIKTDVQQASDATKQLASSLKSQDAPNTDAGTQAKQQVDALATQLQNTINQAQETIANLPQNATLSQAVSQLASLGPSLQSLVTNTKTTLNSIQSSSSDLKKGFQDADSCKKLQRSS